MSDTPIYSDFWLDQERFSDYLDPSDNQDEVFSVDLIKLASVRRIISNYVDILTGDTVPVYFKAVGESYNYGGKEIYITTEIRRKKDFDKAVGLALHEAAHTVLTDFDVVKVLGFNIPKRIWDFCDKNNIRRITMERFIKTMFNIVEDWYIDDWVMKRAPGYIGYYEASYNDIFGTILVDQAIVSNRFRYPSLSSYEFRIVNFANPLTDLTALPGLEDIAKTVDISHIDRLRKTKDRIRTSFEVVDIVLKHLQQFHDKFNPQGQSQPGPKKGKRVSADDFFSPNKDKENSGEGQEGGGGEGDGGGDSDDHNPAKEGDSPKSDVDRTVEDIADALANRPKKEDDENKSMSSQTGKGPDDSISKELKAAIEDQIRYVHGNPKKKELGSEQKTMLDLIEKHGITLVYVPVPIEEGNDAAIKVGCIVVKKLTKELITSGQKIFPMVNSYRDSDGTLQPKKETADAVNRGLILGSKLGRRLMVRRETNTSKEIRKRRGKINKRLLYSAGFDADDFFEKLHIHRYNRGNLHITVDASTSMVGKKWEETMTMCVAIAKATSMVDNVHVTISFRATSTTRGVQMPYIVLAYDSSVDKITKIKSLFKYLHPCGCTPEGLAFGAIMNLFTDIAPDEEDRFFLNISDGEPAFAMQSPETKQTFTYGDGNGVEHTKTQVVKIRNQGVEILAYYVQDGGGGSSGWVGSDSGHNPKKNFQIMYGRDARFIKTDNIVELANTMNELFLRGGR